MNERGFHLLDILFVLLIVGVLFGLGVPGFSRMLERYRLHLAGQNLQSAVAALRTEAVARKLPLSLHVHPQGEAFGFAAAGDAPGHWAFLPRGVRFSAMPRRNVTFHPRGSAAPSGSYVLTNEAGELRFIIALNGRTRWEYVQ